MEGHSHSIGDRHAHGRLLGTLDLLRPFQEEGYLPSISSQGTGHAAWMLLSACWSQPSLLSCSTL